MVKQFKCEVQFAPILHDKDTNTVSVHLNILGNEGGSLKSVAVLKEAIVPQTVDQSVTDRVNADFDPSEYEGYEYASYRLPNAEFHVSSYIYKPLTENDTICMDAVCFVSKSRPPNILKLLLLFDPRKARRLGAPLRTDPFCVTLNELFSDAREEYIPITFGSKLTLDGPDKYGQVWGHPGFQYLNLTRGELALDGFNDPMFTQNPSFERNAKVSLTPHALHRYFHLREALVARVVNELLFPVASFDWELTTRTGTQTFDGAKHPLVSIPATNDEKARHDENIIDVMSAVEGLAMRIASSVDAYQTFFDYANCSRFGGRHLVRGLFADWYDWNYDRSINLYKKQRFLDNKLNRHSALLKSPSWAVLVCRAWLETVNIESRRYQTALHHINEFLTEWPSAQQLHTTFGIISQLSCNIDPLIYKLCDHHLNTRKWFELPSHVERLQDSPERLGSNESEIGRTEFLKRFGFSHLYAD